MIILGMIKKGFHNGRSFCRTNQPRRFRNQQNGFKVRESWSDRLVVLSVCDVVDMLSAPRMSEAICDALGKAPAGSLLTSPECISLPPLE